MHNMKVRPRECHITSLRKNGPLIGRQENKTVNIQNIECIDPLECPWNTLGSVNLSGEGTLALPPYKSVLSHWLAIPSHPELWTHYRRTASFLRPISDMTLTLASYPSIGLTSFIKKLSQVQSVWCLKGSRRRRVLSPTQPTFIMPHKTSTESSLPISYYIPDTLRNWPWPRALCPHHYVCKAESDAWCESFNALSPEGQKAFTSCDFSPSYYHFLLCTTNILACSRSPRVSQLSLCK